MNKIYRLYPNGYTGNSFDELQQLLKEGWIVKMVITVQKLTDGRVISDYVLEKNNP